MNALSKFYQKDRHIARLLVVAEVARALAVRVNSRADNISVRKYRAVRQKRRLLFFCVIKSAGRTKSSVADFLHASHTQSHSSFHSRSVILHFSYILFSKKNYITPQICFSRQTDVIKITFLLLGFCSCQADETHICGDSD